MPRIILFLFLTSISCKVFSQEPSKKVNVYLGTSGDHGQLTPAASSPFSQLSIVPQTYPTLHSGYEYLAKEILGFTHNRLEGVGCTGSGGLILLKPFLGAKDNNLPLIKIRDEASPGNYNIQLKENINVKIAVDDDFGGYDIDWNKGDKGFLIDLSHSFSKGFVKESHTIEGNQISGWIKSKTTCGQGTYTIYYAIEFSGLKAIEKIGPSKISININPEDTNTKVNIAFSAVDVKYAKEKLEERKKDVANLASSKTTQKWDNFLGKIKVEGDSERENLFYSLLYRTLQSPYKISEKDGNYRATNGAIYKANSDRYHGWAIWDNYKTQLPLLAILYPNVYQNIISSIEGLYRYGKYNFAGPTEPSNSVRTEHSAVVLLDAINKGFSVDLKSIQDSLIADTSRLDFSKPDKYLESCYDMWATAKLLEKNKQSALSSHFYNRAKSFVTAWNKDFKDLTKKDVDKMSARNMYQGTIRQYRWSVPFNVVGLREIAGGKASFTNQLDNFFDNYYYNRANEPDMQAQTLYYASDKPWKYQKIVNQLAVDTIVQFYFNDNSRGIDSHIDKLYKNEPKAYVRTMDDDAGAMSAWFVMTAIGLQQPLIGEPIYYLNVPLFPSIEIDNGKSKFVINVKNFDNKRIYISGVILNGKSLDRIWLTHDEVSKGGKLEIQTSDVPSSFGTKNIWISELK